MKIAHWSHLRLELHARRQRLEKLVMKLSGPIELHEAKTVPVFLPDGTPVMEDGVQRTETRMVTTLTPRGEAIMRLRDLAKARSNILRTVR